MDPKKPERKFNPLFWLRVFVDILLAAYLGVVLAGAFSLTTMITAPLKGSICCQTPRDFGTAYQDVSFHTADGLALSGWYVPSKNGAVIILLHSYYMDRRQVLPVAAMLARHGYGLLLYDQRASGKSAGDLRSLGWLDIPDVAQAVAFVRSRPGADHAPLGVYGCSVGGAIALGAAAANPAITAVAADAPSPLIIDEAHPNVGDPDWLISLPIYSLYYRFLALRVGAQPPLSGVEAVRHIAPRPLLLISTGKQGEQGRAELLFAAAPASTTHWNIPAADHCTGPSARPDEYAARLTSFFDQALLRR
jgi:pimeloyl-ACP methyl ester carboxylesterase